MNNEELYEINIDRLLQSFESCSNLSVEDYIDYKNEVFSIEKLKLTRDELVKTKKEVSSLISELYDQTSTMSMMKSSVFQKWLKEKKLKMEKSEIEAVLKRAITYTPKSQFVKSVMDIIYSSDSAKDKNKQLSQGVTIFTLKTKELREKFGESFFKSLISIILEISVFAISFATIRYINAASSILKIVLGALIGNTVMMGVSKIGEKVHGRSSHFVMSGAAEGHHMSKKNKLFKVKWSAGGTARAIGIVLADNITAATLDMKLYPKFKII